MVDWVFPTCPVKDLRCFELGIFSHAIAISNQCNGSLGRKLFACYEKVTWKR